MEQLSKNISLISKLKKYFFPFYKSKEIKTLFNILEKDTDKNSKVAMFVGGCVRKFLDDEFIDDIDIATVFSPEQLKDKFKDTNFKIIETGLEHGSITLIYNDQKFELTTLRKDIETDGRHAEVEFTDDWQKDSERRDFSINAIYMDKKGKIFDPQNGVEDLQNKRIKFIGDPLKRIEEDYLRIIRFIRFSLKYNNLASDPNILKAIKLNLNGIKHLSKERILNELYKIFLDHDLSILKKNLELRNIFQLIFPEFKYLERLEKFKNLVDKNLSRNPEFVFSILIVGDDDNHEYFCHKYKTSNKLKNKLNFFSKNYKLFKENKNFLKKDLKKNVYQIGKDNFIGLLYFIYYSEKNFSKKALDKNLDLVNSISIPDFPFNGDILIKKGITDGKKIGYALAELEKEWIEKDFNLKDQEASVIVDKIKKLDVLNI